MSLRENKEIITSSKIVTVKVKTRTQDMLGTKIQSSTKILRERIMVEETKTPMSQSVSHVGYAKKPHMEIC